MSCFFFQAEDGIRDVAVTGVQTCALPICYLENKQDYLGYATALRQGWPIATGVIEGACRHLVKDRMDITGARWGLEGAEAVLRLRALRSSGDIEAYWEFHEHREHGRNHAAFYTGAPPPTIIPSRPSRRRPNLRLVS